MTILVSLGCNNKIPFTGCFKTRCLFLLGLEARKSKIQMPAYSFSDGIPPFLIELLIVVLVYSYVKDTNPTI